MSGSGLYRLISTATFSEAAASMVLEFVCDSTAAIGDIVYQDDTTPTKVVVNEDNTTTQPSIGVVQQKLTPTRCKVLILGIRNNYSGLQIGSKVFLSQSGTITTTKPNSGYVQTLGIVVAADSIYFTPNATRVLQT